MSTLGISCAILVTMTARRTYSPHPCLCAVNKLGGIMLFIILVLCSIVHYIVLGIDSKSLVRTLGLVGKRHQVVEQKRLDACNIVGL